MSESSREAVYAAIERLLVRAKFAGRFARLGLVSVGAAVAGAAQFMDFATDGPTTAQVVGLVATAAVFIGGFYGAVMDEGAPEQLEIAREAIEEAREIEIRYAELTQVYDQYENDVRRIGCTYLSVIAMRQALEAAAFRNLDGEKLAEKFLELAQPHLPDALSFQNHHQWTIGIYKAVSATAGGQELVLVAKLRAIECDISRARRWSTGTGLAGIAFTGRKGISIENVNDPHIRELIGTNGQSQEGDVERYVSYAIAPILVGPEEEPWGLVVATSNQEGHFSPEGGPGIKTDEAIRALAGMMEVGIAFLEAKAV